MKFYRVVLRTERDSSQGFEFFTNLADAKRAQAEFFRNSYPEHSPSAEIETIEIVPTKRGILAALNRYAGHPDNG